MEFRTLFGLREKHDVFAVLDIGSASVGGAIVEVCTGKRPRIVYQTRVPMHIHAEPNEDRLTASMLASLDLATASVARRGAPFMRLTRLGGGRLGKVFVFYASPWYIAETKVLTAKRPKPFIVSEDATERLLANDAKRFKESQLGPDASYAKRDAELMEQQIIDIRLNGYAAASPFGKIVNDASFTVYTSMLSSSLKSLVEKSIMRTLHATAIDHHSFLLAEYAVVRDVLPDAETMVLIDVTGEVTDVTIVRDGVIKETGSFPYGKNSIVREVAHRLRTSPQDALSALLLHAARENLTGEALKIEEALLVAEESFHEHLDGLLQSLAPAPAHALPRRAVFMADTDVSETIARFLSRSDAKHSFEPVHLTARDIGPFCEFTGIVEDDPFLSLLAIFVSRLHDEHHARLMRKTHGAHAARESANA